MEERIQAILKERFGRDLDNCTKSEIFEALMVITKQKLAEQTEVIIKADTVSRMTATVPDSCFVSTSSISWSATAHSSS